MPLQHEAVSSSPVTYMHNGMQQLSLCPGDSHYLHALLHHVRYRSCWLHGLVVLAVYP
jgi:hypothetical protein